MPYILSLLLLLPVSAAANLETIRWQKISETEVHFWVFQQENGIYTVDRFKKENGNFQERAQSKIFQSKKAALNEFQLIASKTSDVSPLGQNIEANLKDMNLGVIWETKNQWTWVWESKYRDWLEKNADPVFLKKHKIATDCADVAFAYRWIFARIYGLPAANHLVGTNQIFTNESMRAQWRGLQTSRNWYNDRKFLAALRYVLDNTYTHSLMHDSYPIAINKESLSGGVTYLDIYGTSSGHTQFIYNVILDTKHHEPIRALASTVPQEVRELDEYGFQGSSSSMIYGRKALIRFRWPIETNEGWKLRAAEEMPNFSVEQFDSSFIEGFNNIGEAAIFRIMPNWNPDFQNAVKAKVDLILEKFSERVKIVRDGYAYCSRIGGCSYGSEAYEIWSTPSRDAAIEELIYYLYKYYDDSRCTESCRSELNKKLTTRITKIQETTLTFQDALIVWNEGNYSSDPNFSIPLRWGKE
jgi:hypothetical protein